MSDVVAQVIISEIGLDMSRFATVGHLISWAGLCPRNDESAGKRRSTRLRMGAPWLKTILVQAAWCATRAKNTYLRAQFHRIRARRGPKKAIMAVAASILTAVYFMLRDGVEYRDLGPTTSIASTRARPPRASSAVFRSSATRWSSRPRRSAAPRTSSREEFLFRWPVTVWLAFFTLLATLATRSCVEPAREVPHVRVVQGLLLIAFYFYAAK